MGLTNCYKTKVFLHLYLQFLVSVAYSFRPFLRLAVVQYASIYRCLVNYAAVQLRRKRTLLHWSNVIDLHTGTTMSNFSFLVRHLFQFRSWTHHRNYHVILRYHATFHQHRITRCGDMTFYRFSRWRSQWRNFTSTSDWMTSLSSEGQCLSACQISSG